MKKINKESKFILALLIVFFVAILIFLAANSQAPQVNYQGTGFAQPNPVNEDLPFGPPDLSGYEGILNTTPILNKDGMIDTLGRLDENIEFQRDPDRFIYWNEDRSENFVISFADNLSSSTFENSMNDVQIENVGKGAWCSDNKTILFSDTHFHENPSEHDHSHSDADRGFENIYLLKDGEISKLLEGEIGNTNYVCSGNKIAFTTQNTIEIMNIDGSERNIVHEFIEFDNRSEQIYAPQITLVDDETFTVEIYDENYFQNGIVEGLEFSFN